jgi:hypothetical protein
VSESKHTPGNWFYHRPSEHFRPKSDGPYEYSLQNGRTAFILLDFNPDIPIEEREADLRLLAAARDLFEALEAVRPYFEGEHSHDHPHCVQMRAALAKATGAAT